MSRELIIFKKDTDAVGTNRGFAYQYLKTLIQWLKNYHKKVDNLIYCEVEDDIKQVNISKTTMQWTQVKCYSSVFNLEHRDIIKSLYNFYLLFLSYDRFDGSFCFETNTKVSGKDNLLIQWIKEQPLSGSHRELLAGLVVKIQSILKNSVVETKKSKIQDIVTKIQRLESDISKSSAKKKRNKEQLTKLKDELDVVNDISDKLLDKISDVENISQFILKIRWEFEEVPVGDSVRKLKEEAIEWIKLIDPKLLPNLYFNRLLSEIFLKSQEENVDDRCLDNELLSEIFGETEKEIKDNIDKTLIERFDSMENVLLSNFDDVKTTLSTIQQQFETMTQIAASTNDISLIDLPIAELKDVESIIAIDETKQSNLETKIDKISIKDHDQKLYLINIATELRCRYLLFLQKLKMENSHSQYDALRQLETKVKHVCTKMVIDNDLAEKEFFNPIKFWRSFEEELKTLLREVNERKKLDIDEDIVLAQMYQMAAECHLRWHRLEG